MRIFSHSICVNELDPSYHSGDPNFAGYLLGLSQRAVLLASDDDYVILNKALDPEYKAYLMSLGLALGTHLIPQGEGLTLTSRILNDKSLIDLLGRKSTEGNAVLQVYLASQAERELALKISATLQAPNADVAKKVNSKIWFRQKLMTLNLPYTQGVVATLSNLLDATTKLFDVYGKVVVRGDRSFGGTSVWAIKNHADLLSFKKIIPQHNHCTYYLVEKMYDLKSSPNAQFEIDAEEIKTLGFTNQLIDKNLAHKGNSYPIGAIEKVNIISMSKVICSSLQRDNYVGMVGIDFIIDEDKNIIPIEINARLNTSTFALAVLQTLFPANANDKAFKLLNKYHFPECASFVELQLLLSESLLFSKVNGFGIIPYNIESLAWHECDVLIMGNNMKQVEMLEQTLEKAINDFTKKKN